MSNSTYIEVEDDVREDIGECLPSAPKKAEKRVEDVQPAPQEEKATPDNFKYNIGDIIKISDPDTNLCSPASPDKQYHDNLRVIFRFFDGNHVYIVEAEDGICLITPEQQTELVERSTQPNTPPDNKPEPEPQAKTVTTRLSTEQDAATLATINKQNKTIDGLLGEVAQAKHDMERMKKENDANYQQAVGCLDTVKAMLELSQGNGATHRMRDFYGESIIKFIDSARQKLAARHDADPMPF